MNTKSVLIGGTAAGAALMYFLDPAFGKRRRAFVRDKVVHFGRKTGSALDTTGRDIRNRVVGLVSESRHLIGSEIVPDDVLVERGRAVLGRVVSHPSAITITALSGTITLSGSILADEEKPLLRRVLKTRGVRSVENRLEVHDRAENIPGLQGGSKREQRAEWLQSNWSPAARCLGAAAGSGFVFFGIARRGILGVTGTILGAGLFARSTTNLELKRLLGWKAGRRAVDIQKTITIDAPAERVFDIWSKFENFPFFMSRVREVRDLGNGRSHWVALGQANTRIEWDATITQYVPNKILAWKTDPGVPVPNAGIIHFDEQDDKTRVQIRLSYNPPAGAMGHSVAWLFGADPKTHMDADLARMKTFIETGMPPRGAAGREAV
jgi:uncharacterized membrane protein